MEIDEIMMTAEERMENALDALKSQFASVRTGRASAKVLDRIKVDYYGAQTPINQLAGVKTPDARLLVIEPWDKSALKAIEKAIQESDLGVMPSNDGAVIRLPFPELTEERRRELVKLCKGYSEEARVSVRNARRDANAALGKAEKPARSQKTISAAPRPTSRSSPTSTSRRSRTPSRPKKPRSWKSRGFRLPTAGGSDDAAVACGTPSRRSRLISRTEVRFGESSHADLGHRRRPRFGDCRGRCQGCCERTRVTWLPSWPRQVWWMKGDVDCSRSR